MENSEQEYLNKLRPHFANKCDAELELFLAASRPLQRASGLGAHEHRKRGMSRLWPERVWHEWREDLIQSVQYCLEHRIQ